MTSSEQSPEWPGGPGPGCIHPHPGPDHPRAVPADQARTTPGPRTTEEWEERLRAAVEATLRQRDAKRAERAKFKRRRDYGLAARHRNKLKREEWTVDRSRCHIIGRHTGQQCTAEPLDATPAAEIVICMRHAGLVLELVAAAQKARARGEG